MPICYDRRHFMLHITNDIIQVKIMERVKFNQVLLIFIITNVMISDTITVNRSNENTQVLIFNESKGKTNFRSSGKWQVGRVSRKQYEIINMLWRKTKVFIEQDTTSNINSSFQTPKKILYNKSSRAKHIRTDSQKAISKSFLTSMKPNAKHSTPSYIEFYYLDDVNDRMDRTEKSYRYKNSDEYKIAFLRPPFFLFRVNDATCRQTLQNSFTASLRNKPTAKTLKNPDSKNNSTRNFASYKRKSGNSYPLNKMEKKLPSIETKETISSNINNTTPLDRIKFFEIYDSDTYKPNTFLLQNKRMINNDYISFEEKIYLDHIDQKYDKTRFVNKHLDAGFKTQENDSSNKEAIYATKNLDVMLSKTSLYLSQPAAWSDYPFIGVYVYEPEQVRCDCASISPYWLVGAATCLQRYRKDFRADSRSAFVAYCTNKWSHGRIAYVSKILVHPEFNTKHYTRRQHYNIGVIQVVTSMANTCNGWQPVTLMSHRFSTDHGGSVATAVGWGLYRYDTKYGTSDLPPHPLMTYKGLVYSDSCPGSIAYSERKQLNEESVKNVYCLSLPPYIMEENDTVHGGLLLVEGKLIALYSQEERRSWGEQSAQYTGIWHLIPWLNDVAGELDEPDSIDSDI